MIDGDDRVMQMSTIEKTKTNIMQNRPWFLHQAPNSSRIMLVCSHLPFVDRRHTPKATPVSLMLGSGTPNTSLKRLCRGMKDENTRKWPKKSPKLTPSM
jgi:hypothetical protein